MEQFQPTCDQLGPNDFRSLVRHPFTMRFHHFPVAPVWGLSVGHTGLCGTLESHNAGSTYITSAAETGWGVQASGLRPVSVLTCSFQFPVCRNEGTWVLNSRHTAAVCIFHGTADREKLTPSKVQEPSPYSPERLRHYLLHGASPLTTRIQAQ